MPAKRALFAYIRWSSDKQTEGDSLRRQTDLAKAYASRHRLELPKENILIDEGVSADKGSNIKTGKPGKLLAGIWNQEIERGSILLVEEIDRLSRGDPLDTQVLLRDIVT